MPYFWVLLKIISTQRYFKNITETEPTTGLEPILLRECNLIYQKCHSHTHMHDE
jgi:hypothetical protein